MGVFQYIVLAVCVLNSVSWSVSAVCNMYACDKYLSVNPALSEEQLCQQLVQLKECAIRLKTTCSQQIYDEVRGKLKEKGVDIETDIKNDCCDPEINLQKRCITKTMENDNNFKANHQACRTVEQGWRCSRPYYDRMEKCEITLVKEAVKIGNTVLTNKLEKCEKNGYNVTVDFRGAGSTIQNHPVMTLVVVVSTIFLGLSNLRF